MDAAARLTAARLPVWTLAICASAVLIFLSPFLESILIYDRTAIANGEIWRLVTGNLVHFSATHLAYDLAALLVVGTIIESRGYKYYPVLCFAAALFIGIVLYRAEPGMHYFAGLSGVTTAAIVYMCLHGLTEKGAWRWLCTIVLFGIVIKSGIELTFRESFLFISDTGEFLPAPLSHLAGAGTAVFLYILFSLTRKWVGVRHPRFHGHVTGQEKKSAPIQSHAAGWKIVRAVVRKFLLRGRAWNNARGWP